MQSPSPYFIQLRRALSNSRLDAYRRSPGEDDLDLLARYFWNMALGEALYPVIQALEVALRNSLHAALAAAHGPRWFDLPTVLVLAEGQQAVQSAKQALTAMGRPHAPDRIVAELHFGFWTGLLSRQYEQPPHARGQRPLWPALLQPAFPALPRRLRTRGRLAGRLHDIRRFRNRVFHHEPISRAGDLPRRHAEILETLTWINPALHETVQLLDRFPQVYGQGVVFYRGELERHARGKGYIS